MSIQNAVVTIGTTPTPLNTPQASDSTFYFHTSSTFYIGNSTVTALNGFPVSGPSPYPIVQSFVIPANEIVYGIASGTLNINVLILDVV